MFSNITTTNSISLTPNNISITPITTTTATPITTTNISYQDLIAKPTIQPVSVSKTEKEDFYFIDIKEYCPNKVYGFTFSDGDKVKTVCDDADIFSLKYAFFLAIAKKLYGKTYTLNGVLMKANELALIKKWNKVVDKGIKLYFKQQEEKLKKEEEIKANKEKNKAKARKREEANKKKKEEFFNNLGKTIQKAIQEEEF